MVLVAAAAERVLCKRAPDREASTAAPTPNAAAVLRAHYGSERRNIALAADEVWRCRRWKVSRRDERISGVLAHSMIPNREAPLRSARFSCLSCGDCSRESLETSLRATTSRPRRTH
jgi:hypothetical protein